MNFTEGVVIVLLGVVILSIPVILVLTMFSMVPTPTYSQHRKILAARTLYRKAWGRPWPHQQRKTIQKSRIVPASYSIDDGDGYVFADVANIPETIEYTCLYEINQVAQTFGSTLESNFLLIRDEYLILPKMITNAEVSAIVVTGQEGIGKSTFLLYLLLHRLERKQPTAVQFDATWTFIFDKHGVDVRKAEDSDPVRLSECWALADSNVNVIQPCEAFQVHAQCVIQTSPPKYGRWKSWIEQKQGTCIVFELPTVVEIAAILEEQNLDARLALPLIDKWGPSIRTLLDISRNPNEDIVYELKAEIAAQAMVANPHSINIMQGKDKTMIREGSTIVFYRPNRFENNGITVSARAIPFVPTRYLFEVFERIHTLSKNKNALDLYCNLKSQAVTRNLYGYGWYHERRMHSRMCADGPTLEIYSDHGRKHIQPSSTLLPAIKSKLKHSHPIQSYYWMPSAVNLAGVDGVLRNDDDIYMLQATVAEEEYREPSTGIRAVWDALPSNHRDNYTCHFVVVSDTEETATLHLKASIGQLKKFTLDVDGRKKVAVWACQILNTYKYG